MQSVRSVCLQLVRVVREVADARIAALNGIKSILRYPKAYEIGLFF